MPNHLEAAILHIMSLQNTRRVCCPQLWSQWKIHPRDGRLPTFQSKTRLVTTDNGSVILRFGLTISPKPLKKAKIDCTRWSTPHFPISYMIKIFQANQSHSSTMHKLMVKLIIKKWPNRSCSINLLSTRCPASDHHCHKINILIQQTQQMRRPK